MKRTLFLIILSLNTLLANSLSTNVSSYYESYNFKDSTIKNNGYTVGFIAKIKDGNSIYKIGYENEHIKNIPTFNAIHGNFNIYKLYSKYTYKLNDSWKLNINYINILNDNIAPTSDGSIYGLGITYNINNKLSFNFTEFYSDYKKFDVYQSDMNLVYKIKISKIKVKLQGLAKIINLKNYENNGYTKNADSNYLTTAIKVGAAYNSYSIGGGVFFGKRAFAVLSDGFKVQHHALNFSEVYTVVLAKKVNNFDLKFQYIDISAKELGSLANIKVDVFKVVAGYKF